MDRAASILLAVKKQRATLVYLEFYQAVVEIGHYVLPTIAISVEISKRKTMVSFFHTVKSSSWAFFLMRVRGPKHSVAPRKTMVHFFYF